MNQFEIFKELSKTINKNGGKLYLVGGAVRDFLNGRNYKDFDFVSDLEPSEIEKIFPGNKSSYKSLGSITFIYKNERIDITTLRTEENYLDYRHPREVTFVKDLELDSKRRDFTINAIYMDSEMNVYDYHNGIADLKKGILRCIGDPYIRFEEDPLRILRAIRFKTTLYLEYDASLANAIINQRHLLKHLSVAKIKEEINKVPFENHEKMIAEIKHFELDKVIPITYSLLDKPIIDLHCDTLTALLDKNQKLIKNDLHVDLNKLKTSSYAMQAFAIFINKKRGNLFELANKYLDNFESELAENKTYIQKVTNYDEYLKVRNYNRIGALITLEGGEIIEGDLNKLEHFYNRGCRLMTLTWNFENELGHPQINLDKFKGITFVESENGLTSFGIEVVKKMNKLGMIIDVSHLSDKGTEDVIKYSTYPIVASHSNSRFVDKCSRNLSDDLIKQIALKGGVIGINFCKDFVTLDSNASYMDELVKHIKHIKDIAGINVLALGSDFDGIDTPPLLSDASKINLLYERLLKEGFEEKELDKMFSKNFLRVFKKVCK